jgi:hypothetical protein
LSSTAEVRDTIRDQQQQIKKQRDVEAQIANLIGAPVPDPDLLEILRIGCDLERPVVRMAFDRSGHDDVAWCPRNPG